MIGIRGLAISRDTLRSLSLVGSSLGELDPLSSRKQKNWCMSRINKIKM